MAFFQFYASNPRDLDLGFYLFRGGMKPRGLGKERDETLEIRSLNNARAARGRKGKAADLGFKPNGVQRVE